MHTHIMLCTYYYILIAYVNILKSALRFYCPLAAGVYDHMI